MRRCGAGPRRVDLSVESVKSALSTEDAAAGEDCGTGAPIRDRGKTTTGYNTTEALRSRRHRRTPRTTGARVTKASAYCVPGGWDYEGLWRPGPGGTALTTKGTEQIEASLIRRSNRFGCEVADAPKPLWRWCGRAEDDRRVVHDGVSLSPPRAYGATEGHVGEAATAARSAPPGGHGVPAAVNVDSDNERRSFSGVHAARRGVSQPVREVRHGRLCPYPSGF